MTDLWFSLRLRQKKVRENLIMIIRKIAEITSLYMFFVGFSLPLSCPPAPVVTDVISSFEVTGNSLHTKPRHFGKLSNGPLKPQI